jgi:hypothetical protein
MNYKKGTDMRKRVISLSIFLITTFFFTGNALADDCTDWNQSSSSDAALKVCQYDSGGSGYARVKNTGYVTARICYELTRKGSKVEHGCNTLAPGSETKFSCFGCAERNGGIDRWSATYEEQY